MISKFGRFFCTNFQTTYLFKAILALIQTNLEFLKTLIKLISFVFLKYFLLIQKRFNIIIFWIKKDNANFCLLIKKLILVLLATSFYSLLNKRKKVFMGSSGAGATYNQMVRNPSIHPSIATESVRKSVMENTPGIFNLIFNLLCKYFYFYL